MDHRDREENLDHQDPKVSEENLDRGESLDKLVQLVLEVRGANKVHKVNLDHLDNLDLLVHEVNLVLTALRDREESRGQLDVMAHLDNQDLKVIHLFSRVENVTDK